MKSLFRVISPYGRRSGIVNRQGPKETLGVFVSNMTGLFSRLAEEVSEERKLKIMRKNLSPFYLETLALQQVLSSKKMREIANAKTMVRN